MISTSEMYRISGGCTIGRFCGECANYIESKELSCIVYPKKYGAVWDGGKLACKYFREREEGHQMDISDWIKELTKGGPDHRPGK